MAIGQVEPMGGKADDSMGTVRGIRGQVIMERDTERDMGGSRSTAGAGCDALAKVRDIGRGPMATHSQPWAMREAMCRRLKDPPHKDLLHNGLLGLNLV
jgi:hypothetical protein